MHNDFIKILSTDGWKPSSDFNNSYEHLQTNAILNIFADNTWNLTFPGSISINVNIRLQPVIAVYSSDSLSPTAFGRWNTIEKTSELSIQQILQYTKLKQHYNQIKTKLGKNYDDTKTNGNHL